MKRHSTDLVSLTFGLIFAAIAGWWLVGRSVPNVNVPNLGLIIAAGLIALGLLGVVGSLRHERRHRTRTGAGAGAVATDRLDDPDLGGGTFGTDSSADTTVEEPILGDPENIPTVITTLYADADDTAQLRDTPDTHEANDPSEPVDAEQADDVPSRSPSERDNPSY
jgi:hypothetical protein